jgi:TRAP-type mannitol/chloroaromatic compound transport system permease small subunit
MGGLDGVMRGLLRFATAVDRLNALIGRGVSWLMLAAVLICAAAATARYALNIGSNAWLEIQWYLNAAVWLLVAGYTLRRQEHVRIDVIFGKLPVLVQSWIDIVGGLVMLLPATLIIGWYSLPSLTNSWQIQEYSSDPGGLIRWPVRLLIPIAFALLALQGVSQIIKRIGFLQGRVGAEEFEKKAHGVV